jgi:hypothetical protein
MKNFNGRPFFRCFLLRGPIKKKQLGARPREYGALERRLRTISQRDVKRRNTTTANKPRKHDKEVQGTPQTQ